MYIANLYIPGRLHSNLYISEIVCTFALIIMDDFHAKWEMVIDFTDFLKNVLMQACSVVNRQHNSKVDYLSSRVWLAFWTPKENAQQ